MKFKIYSQCSNKDEPVLIEEFEGSEDEAIDRIAELYSEEIGHVFSPDLFSF